MGDVQLLGELIEKHRVQMNVDTTRGGWSFIVSADGAAVFMREIFGSGARIKYVEIRQEEDTLFHYKNVPVRLRFNSHPGACLLLRDGEVPARSCCDQASAASVMAALTKGQA